MPPKRPASIVVKDALADAIASSISPEFDHKQPPSNVVEPAQLRRSTSLFSLERVNGSGDDDDDDDVEDPIHSEIDFDPNTFTRLHLRTESADAGAMSESELPNVLTLNLSRHSTRSSTKSSLYGLSRTSSASSGKPRTYVRLDNQSSRPTNVFAQSITVVDYMRVGDTGPSGYIVYNCRAVTSEGTALYSRKRFSDFITLRKMLKKAFPRLRQVIPKLPPKTVVGKFRSKFLEKRRQSLEYFLACVLLHPTLGGSVIVRNWFTEQ